MCICTYMIMYVHNMALQCIPLHCTALHCINHYIHEYVDERDMMECIPNSMILAVSENKERITNKLQVSSKHWLRLHKHSSNATWDLCLIWTAPWYIEPLQSIPQDHRSNRCCNLQQLKNCPSFKQNWLAWFPELAHRKMHNKPVWWIWNQHTWSQVESHG